MNTLPDTQFEELKGMFSALSEKIVSMDEKISSHGLKFTSLDAKMNALTLHIDEKIDSKIDEFSNVVNREFGRIHDRFDRLESYTYEGFTKVNSDIKYLHSEMSDNFKEVRKDMTIVKETYATKQDVVTIYTSLVPSAVSSTS